MDTDDLEICSACNGSGEGQFDGSTCPDCRGSGVERGETDADDFDIPIDWDA